MDQVDDLLKIGILSLKDQIIIAQKEAKPDGDHAALEAWEPVMNFEWDDMAERLSMGVWHSAHARYVDWFTAKKPKRKGSSKTSGSRKKARMI